MPCDEDSSFQNLSPSLLQQQQWAYSLKAFLGFFFFFCKILLPVNVGKFFRETDTYNSMPDEKKIWKGHTPALKGTLSLFHGYGRPPLRSLC